MKVSLSIKFGQTKIENIIYCDPTNDELHKIVADTMKTFQQLKISSRAKRGKNENI